MAGASDDTDRLKRALRREGVSMRCAACDWTLDGPLGEYRLVPETGGAGADARGIQVMVYACRNCGYIRLHSAAVLQDIISEEDALGGQAPE